MAGEKIDIANAKTEASSAKRDRSTIEFPYGDLEDALQVIDAIHQHAGTECQTDQLAGFLRQSASSGAFRLKIQVARMGGLVAVERGAIALTELGRQATDPALRGKSVAAAFLSIPLYAEIYQKYKGRQLPPTAALEREMANFGVAGKQTGKARQAFERSAEQSGFYNDTRDRLIEPVFRGSAPLPKVDPPKDPPRFGGGGGGDDLHPFIRGLLETLPQPGTEWSGPDRANWLEAASKIFGLIYEGDGRAISVQLESGEERRPIVEFITK